MRRSNVWVTALPTAGRVATIIAVVGLAGAACHPASPAPPRAPGAADSRVRVVALISASAEWKIVRGQIKTEPLHDTPYGEWFTHRLGSEDVVFFHGGYGKVAAAGSTQYAIDRWHPTLVVNIGTCGGFGARKVGDIVLASETTIYDIVEMMGDPDEAIADYRTAIDTAVWPARLAGKVVRGPLVSGDRDLDPAAIAGLAAKYHASAGDWESGAIAWVAAHNHTRVLILRGVSDVIDAQGGDPTYHAPGAWEKASIAVMASLVALLGDALPDLVNAPPLPARSAASR
jgi:adenosylhomocysteine nucleosidase